MNSVPTRANSVFFYGVSVLGVLCALNWLTSYWYTYDVSVASISNVRVTRLVEVQHPVFRRVIELAEMRFDADINASGVFNWNTKQVFVYVQADVETRAGRRFRQVIWDRVVNRTDQKNLRLRKQEAEYPILMAERGDTLEGAKVALSVGWDVMPVSGAMRSSTLAGEKAVAGIRIPTKMCAKAARCRKTASGMASGEAAALARAGREKGSWLQGVSKGPSKVAASESTIDEL